jgi:hypothetical protein
MVAEPVGMTRMVSEMADGALSRIGRVGGGMAWVRTRVVACQAVATTDWEIVRSTARGVRDKAFGT